MLKNQKKKQIFYEVNPLFFYDSNNDGFGDFNGLSKKTDYFKFIDINCVIIPDIFNNYNNLLFNEFINFKSKYGNINELKELILNFEKQKINIAVEINLKDIQKSLLFSINDKANSYDYEFNESKKAFFLDKNNDNNISENWNSIKTMKAFDKIIKFWLNLNVKNFVFVNFEYLYDKNEIFNQVTFDQMNNLYKLINVINNDVTIIIKSALLSKKHIDDCLNLKDPSADFFIDNSFSLIGTNNKTKNDKFEKFKPYKMFSKIKRTLPLSDNHQRIVMSLGSSLSGRINSRWGDEGSFSSVSSKALITISLLSPNSSSIYYGDELGMLKINIKNKESFHDIYALERGQLLQSQGQSKDDFMKAQQYLSPINTQSLFQWDDSKNGGFSRGVVTVRQLSTTYKEINASKQYADSSSSLIYLKTIIAFIKNPVYSHFFNDPSTTFGIKLISRDIIKYTYKLNDEKILVYINLAKKWKKINIKSSVEVVFSNYSEKKYNGKIKMLSPFESIILFSKKD